MKPINHRGQPVNPHRRGLSSALLVGQGLLIVLACIASFVLLGVGPAIFGDSEGDATPEPFAGYQRQLDFESPTPATGVRVNDPAQATIAFTRETDSTIQEAVEAINAVGGSVAFDGEKRLIQVALSGPFVTDEVMPYLVGKKHLEGVILENTIVSDKGVACLAGLTNLRRLLIRGRNMTDNGMAHLKDLTRMGALVIECADVTDAGVTHLSGMSELRSLSLDNTQVGDDGLAQVAKLSNLIELSLFNTRVSDEGLKHLERLQKLQRLSIQSTNVTVFGKAQVERSRSPDFILAF